MANFPSSSSAADMQTKKKSTELRLFFLPAQTVFSPIVAYIRPPSFPPSDPQVRDLLDPRHGSGSEAKLEVRQGPDGNFVPGLTSKVRGARLQSKTQRRRSGK